MCPTFAQLRPAFAFYLVHPSLHSDSDLQINSAGKSHFLDAIPVHRDSTLASAARAVQSGAGAGITACCRLEIDLHLRPSNLNPELRHGVSSSNKKGTSYIFLRIFFQQPSSAIALKNLGRRPLRGALV